MLFKLETVKYAMSFDLSMEYYPIRLSENSSNLCTIILLWGKDHYKFLPMGVRNSPYIFQQKNECLFPRVLMYTCIYRQSFNFHKILSERSCTKLELTLHQLKEEGIKLNIDVFP